MTSMQVVSLTVFLGMLAHMFLSQKISHLGHIMPWKRLGKIIDAIGESELAPPVWGVIALITLWISIGQSEAIHLLKEVNFVEPLGLGALALVGYRVRLLKVLEIGLIRISKRFPGQTGFIFLTSWLVPLTGSAVTEPTAAIWTTRPIFNQLSRFNGSLSRKLRYDLLGCVPTNLSIGGAITKFAAPAVVVVSAIWGWSNMFMLTYFAPIVIAVTFINAAVLVMRNYHELKGLELKPTESEIDSTTIWLTVIDLILVILTVLAVMSVNVMLILLVVATFLIVNWAVPKEYTDEIEFGMASKVMLFLGGLLIVGHLQGWWVSQVIRSLSDVPLYFTIAGLTSITDNALLTLLVALTAGIALLTKVLAVAAALGAGGTTLMANAPNVIVKLIWQSMYSEQEMSMARWFRAALIYATITLCLFLAWFLILDQLGLLVQ